MIVARIFWIWPVTPRNWPTVKSKKIWAVRIKGKGKRISKGDKIIFYVNTTMHFHGIYEVKNDWHEPTGLWPDNDPAAVSEIDLVEIQLGFANVSKLAPSLNFIKKKDKSLIGLYLRGTPSGPANAGKPISEVDYELILDELKQVQQEPDFEKIKEQTSELEELVELPSNNYSIAKIPPPEKKTLDDIFRHVEGGDLAVPDFQRYWTWKRKQIEELWESIFQGYYIGALLTWPSSGQKLSKIPIQGGPRPTEKPDLILDGQQRITAIYYAIKAPPIPLPSTGRYEFFLNINALLDPSRDSSEIIDSYTVKKIEQKHLHDPKTQYKQKIFPLTKFQNKGYKDWTFSFYRYLQEDEGYSEEEARKYHNKLDEVFDNVWSSYEIPVVKLPDSLHLDNVATIFERINSKGTALGMFDLLNARFITYGIVLKKLWEYVMDGHENIKKWYNKYNNDKIPLYIIQAISLSQSGFIKRKYILNLDEKYKNSAKFQSKTFLNDWKTMSYYVEEAITRIISRDEFGAIRYDFIPYTIMVPMIAALLKTIENRPDRPSCLDKIRFWYWNTMLEDNYSSSTETKIESDFKLMKRWFDGEISDPFKTKERDDFNVRNSYSALYKAIMCIIAKKGTLDFVRGDAQQYGTQEDHHIFPHSKAERFNAGDDINSILNRTLVFDTTNRFLKNKNPSEYLNDIMGEQKIDQMELQKRLSTHLISPDALKCMLEDDFSGFIQERAKTIQKEFQKILYPETEDASLDIRELLKGEDQNVEFKETLRWDVRANQINQALEETVMKEIASFANSDGGKILIGVDDAGTVLGLERDYKTLSKKNSGQFQEHLTNLINKHLGKITNSYVDWKFCKVDGHEICLGTITPSPRPIYVRVKNNKKFYVRHNNTCQPYDVEEANNYFKEHWG